MLAEATSGTPVDVPAWLHLALWPALALWVGVCVWRRHRGTWPGSGRLGLALAPVCLLTDGAALWVSQTWPSRDSNSLVFALLWLALAVSLTAYLALSAPDDGDDGEGWEEDEPEPPWWPEFDREFREYARSRGPAPRDRSLV
jgi:hypothetical protein